MFGVRDFVCSLREFGPQWRVEVEEAVIIEYEQLELLSVLVSYEGASDVRGCRAGIGCWCMCDRHIY